uniref:Enoyl reductase (ER) domain-containing protein n=1 Tax=Mucochytrium quahogii TaxID=96639 RepID=A0A7S2WB73_9STRA|mmetsp:Transcript_11254/g.18385  ORF Transcript_11254/g.18385 Transcript_11254/m.18385 type:complete len:386 (-) Transcript_11254:1357-2514(-)|eukprot:CAMPEP_0203762764 /NCGR_PEP_ID=MMETSP0098-20131031/15577_1 /ASSEMBLY_ACC=CAM_ASM_000208 /TAXON_ID=96639 /ORGANISM=" , Strain NY0313808BC1" /LENGTH=385 /DNA_ID=CAMNT_0050657305 /DNA_START=310 /DNA_END=1467 /DNA_ORIENTATION=-
MGEGEGKMKAVCFVRPFELAVQVVDKPRVLDKGDCVVKVKYAAICGSDLHPYRGNETGLDAGTIMGHEFVGQVVEKGADVLAHEIGDQVMCPFTTSCGNCTMCRLGLTCRCLSGQLFGWVENGQGLHGGQAEFVRVPLADTCLVKVPNGLDLKKAILLGDILATGFYCALRSGLCSDLSPTQPIQPPGQDVVNHEQVIAVIGCGPVGLCTIAAARYLIRLSGTRAKVVAVDCIPERLDAATKMGATDTINYKQENVPEVVQNLSMSSLGADFVLEIVGQPSAMKTAYDILRPGGVISSVGVHAYEKNTISPQDAYNKNISFHSGRCPAREIMGEKYQHHLLAVLQDIPLDTLFTHQVALDDAVSAYKLFDTRSESMIKCLIDMDL